ncbi:hypothetical protein PV325_002203 [Microctonus aethiopoides]|nr:hypothetical protein PV325_002203 [Microctonus aethiopoides]
MDPEDHTLSLIRQEIVKYHLQVTAIIQDIQQCTGSLELLNELNAEGRAKINALRSSIDKLAHLAETEINVKRKSQLMNEVENRRSQLSFVLSAFKKANIIGVCVIDKMAKDELLSTSEEEQNLLRKRRDRKGLADTAGSATDRLLHISRALAEANQRSADTLDTLLISSDKVNGTKDELEQQQQAIAQSGKLLGKYGRREVTDKALIALALIFFFACVIYIIQKRVCITAAPWLEKLFTGYNKPRRANNKNHRKQNRDKDNGQSWKDICRLMNPSGHAFPGRGPYAACPW